MKSKTTAGVLAFFLGGLGVHKFYLGRTGIGFLYLIFFWTFLPALVAFVDAIILFTMDDVRFHHQYNPAYALASAPPAQQPIVVSVNQTVGPASVSSELRELASLRDSGALSEDEFLAQKQRLLQRGA
jgi:TM2 domain-containing membrane protein YozV